MLGIGHRSRPFLVVVDKGLQLKGSQLLSSVTGLMGCLQAAADTHVLLSSFSGLQWCGTRRSTCPTACSAIGSDWQLAWIINSTAHSVSTCFPHMLGTIDGLIGQQSADGEVAQAHLGCSRKLNRWLDGIRCEPNQRRRAEGRYCSYQ
jgi:hypothetical protein